jgi:hypothetical protein
MATVRYGKPKNESRRLDFVELTLGKNGLVDFDLLDVLALQKNVLYVVGVKSCRSKLEK